MNLESVNVRYLLTHFPEFPTLQIQKKELHHEKYAKYLCGFFNETRMAAAQGDVEAQYNLGFMLSEGEGVIQNPEEAYFWILLSASSGFEIARKNLRNVNNKLNRSQIKGVKIRVKEWINEHKN